MSDINPWNNLPQSQPYILSADFELINNHKSFQKLRLDVLPEPFIGDINSAKVIFLALNPGFSPLDVEVSMKSKQFISQVRQNLVSGDTPFYYFAGGLEDTGGYGWWRSKLKSLFADGITEQQLAKNMMCVEYFPYHSIKYKPTGPTLESQHYSFALVRKAIKDNKLIVIVRSKRLWLEAIPELNDYQHLRLNSCMNVTVSPGNLPPGGYSKILSALSQ